MTMLKSQQYKQRLKLLEKEISPPRKWKSRSLLSVQSSGDIKWGNDTVRRHSDTVGVGYGLPKGYFSNAVGSPRGDVELAEISRKEMSPVRMEPVRRVIDYSTTVDATRREFALQPRLVPVPQVQLGSSIYAEMRKVYISCETKEIMRNAIDDELHTFPFTVANMAQVLINNKAVLESIVDGPSPMSGDDVKENDSDGLLYGLMTISLSEDDEMENSRKRKTEGYKAALSPFITRGNQDFVKSWEECEEKLAQVFLWSKDVQNDDESVAIVTENEEELASVENEAPFVFSSSTPAKAPHSARKKLHTKSIPKKALPSPLKAAVKSMKLSIKSLPQKVKKDPSHLSLDSFRKMIQDKVGPSKWNRVFRHPHHSTTVMEEAATRLDERIEALEQSRTSKVDDILARREEELAKRQEEEQRRQASERASSLLRPLTEEEESIVQKALYGIGPTNEILASQDADSVQRGSMQRLQPGQWLNDEIINYFLKNCLAKRDEKLCAAHPGRKRSHFFNSYFVQTLFDEKNANQQLRGKYAYKNVKRWSKKVPGKDIFNLKYIVCPINLDNMHWTSAVIFMEEKKIQYYDSLGGTDWLKLEGLLEYLKDEWRAKKGGEMDASEWKLVDCQSDTPRQLNGYDCGVFTCMFSDFISQDCPLVFNQKHVNQCRERIALSIMKNCAIE